MFIRESISEHFQTLHKRIKYAAIGVFAALTVVLWLTLPLRGAQALLVGVGAGIVGALLVTVYLRSKFRCPTCRTDLLALQKQQAAGDKRMFWEIWEKCPKCSLPFNDVWPP